MLVSSEEAECRRLSLELIKVATGKFKVLVQWLFDEYDTREAVIAKIEKDNEWDKSILHLHATGSTIRKRIEERIETRETILDFICSPRETIPTPQPNPGADNPTSRKP